MRIAFTFTGHAGWTGGSNYLKNLLQALHRYSGDSIQAVLVAGHNAGAGEIVPLRPYLSEIITDKSFTLWSPEWFIRQIVRRTLDKDLIVERMFKRHDIDAVFHAGLFGGRFSVPCVNWIADFQHVYMPEMFSPRDRNMRDRLFRDLARMCRRLVLSSECAKKDFESFLPAYRDRVDVLRFVAQTPVTVYAGNPLAALRSHDIPEKFFHLPNQFWKHKNHEIVIEALQIVKSRNHDIFVVCTGNENDYRNPGYFGSLKRKIVETGLTGQIALLGFVPIDQLYALMRQSVAIINPSFFEGWSTTVEEVKSLGKKILVSDIPVHREQAPPGGTYFDPEGPEDLAEKMVRIWEETPAGPDLCMEAEATASQEARVQGFAHQFAQIMRNAVG
jgi:glycosyltransferase involved in cell wall biosynthesis